MRIIGALSVSLVPRWPAAATGVAPTNTVYFPPGSRLGIARHPDLDPMSGNPRRLLSPDHTLAVAIYEPPWTDTPHDAVIWNQELADADLIREESFNGSEVRRVFLRRSETGPDPDYGWWTLIIRRPQWFGQLDLTTQPVGHRAAGMTARWSDVIDAVIASARVRAPLNVSEFLVEHGLTMDVDGLNPRHFGDKLVLSLEPPRTPAQALTMDHYIAMETPPRPILGPETDEERGMVPWELSEPAWRGNGIDWHDRGRLAISLGQGPDLVTRTLTGYGATRALELVAYSRGGDPALFQALERVARSTVLLG